MIYTNFIFFIVAIASFAMSPGRGANILMFPMNLVVILLSMLWFWIYNRNKFMKLRYDLESESLSISEAKRIFQRTVTRQLVGAVFLFAMETYLFDLKRLLLQLPGIWRLDVLVNAAGLLVFILNMAIVWYWAYQALGEVLNLGKSAAHYVLSNVKFNLVTVVPWLLLMAFFDVFNLDNIPMLLQMGIFIAFMMMVALFSPLLVVWLWDCVPIAEGELKSEILAYCASQGIKFKGIMSWNALNGSLVTAGVIGLLYPFRYLMLTPELMRMLSKDELMAVVSHETAHVKKKHMLYYLLFFIGFLLVSTGFDDWMMRFFLTPIGTSFRLTMSDTLFGFLQVILTLATFLVYFRFIFGYFMRNFERQADVYCFESGINPAHMIGSFEKLGGYTVEGGKKSNWHHFTIPQRMDFIDTCIKNPELITEHTRKVNRLVAAFMGFLIVVAVLSLAPNGMKTPYEIQLSHAELDMLARIRVEPNNPQWYMYLGMISYEMKKWQQTRDALENSLKLDYRNPETLNSLAWFFLTCPDPARKDIQRALDLARDAIKLRPAAHIFDTLSEAYYQNAMYPEAYRAAKQALHMATVNRKYYQSQLEKMYKYYLKSKSSIKI